jgi:hypothetical protein
LCQVWLKLAQWFWRRSRKCKSLQTHRRTDDGQRAIRIAHLSFQLRWAKKKTQHIYTGIMFYWEVIELVYGLLHVTIYQLV